MQTRQGVNWERAQRVLAREREAFVACVSELGER